MIDVGVVENAQSHILKIFALHELSGYILIPYTKNGTLDKPYSWTDDLVEKLVIFRAVSIAFGTT